MKIFLKKFPSLGQIAPVYALIMVVIYSWTMMRFLGNSLPGCITLLLVK